jgi:hypothetical protein
MNMRLGTTVGLTAALVALISGCGAEVPKPKPSVRSNVQVALPEKPDLTVKPFKKVHEDGTATVEGVLREREKYVGGTITVRGVVQKLVVCPQPALPDAGDVAIARPRPERTCNPPPHFFLIDKEPVSKRELLVYGSMWSVLPQMKDGEEVTLTGAFDIVSKDGVFLRQAGLLLLDDLPEPKPAEDATP